MRTITVFSTLGKNAEEVSSSAKTWSELQKDLSSKSISYSGMKAVVGETRLTVESPNAVLPETNFSLYLMPVKTKSGADRKELFTAIKEIILAQPSAKNFFTIDGKNMTQLTTKVLENLLAAHYSFSSASQVKTITAGEAAQLIADDITDRLYDIQDDYGSVVEDVNAMVAEIVAFVKNEEITPNVQKVLHVESAEEVAKIAERLEKEKKNKEMAIKANSLMNDFSDVKR